MKTMKFVKKMICAILTVCLLVPLLATAASAEVINLVYVKDQLTSTPEIYLGEIVLDGVPVLHYVNSDGPLWLLYYIGSAELDQITSEIISAMGDTAFYDLISARWDQARAASYDYYVNHTIKVEPSIRLCSDEDLTDAMDAGWNSASAVAAQLYTAATLVSETNGNVYDLDEGFAAALEAYELERREYIDEPIEADKCIIMATDANCVDNVHYEVENGQVVKYVETTLTHDCAAITVYYTRAELSSAAAPSEFTWRELDDGTLEITGYTGNADEVTVPSQIDGKTVTGIAADLDAYEYDVFAWQDEDYNFHSPSVIHLPDTLTYIGEFAFSSCIDLTEIEIPAGVESIGDYAFSCCENLTSVDLPAGVTTFGCEVFDCCSALEEIVLPDSLTDIPRGTFFWCSTLHSVTLPSGLTAIGDEMFSGCTSLMSIDIPATVTSIGQYAFFDCGLTGIAIPAGTTVTASETGTDINGNEYTIEYFPVGFVTDPDTGDAVPVDDFTVYCYRGSSAEAYALGYGFHIVYLENALQGDVNADRILDIADVSALLLILDGASASLPVCDVNNDGINDITDVTALLNLLAEA